MKGKNVVQRRYTGHHCGGNDAQGRNKSREVATDGIRRLAGPHGGNDPRYLDTLTRAI